MKRSGERKAETAPPDTAHKEDQKSNRHRIAQIRKQLPHRKGEGPPLRPGEWKSFNPLPRRRLFFDPISKSNKLPQDREHERLNTSRQSVNQVAEFFNPHYFSPCHETWDKSSYDNGSSDQQDILPTAYQGKGQNRPTGSSLPNVLQENEQESYRGQLVKDTRKSP